MKIPKERLKEIYDEYLEENQKRFNSKRELHPFILLTFWEYLEFVRYKDKTEHLPLLITSECGFSTTSECRKAINELESTTITLPIIQEKRQYDILSDSKTEKVVIYSAELENRDENTHIITWTGSNGYGQLTFKWIDNRYVLDSEMLDFDTIVKIIQKLQDI